MRLMERLNRIVQTKRPRQRTGGFMSNRPTINPQQIKAPSSLRGNGILQNAFNAVQQAQSQQGGLLGLAPNTQQTPVNTTYGHNVPNLSNIQNLVPMDLGALAQIFAKQRGMTNG